MSSLVGKTLKAYHIHEQIGAGGFGAVYRASQPSIGREVAIKVILPDRANHPDFIHRFESEAHLVARLEHPHIVPLFDYWRDPEGAYLVMRWLPMSLRKRMSEGPFTLDEISCLLEQVCSALSIAHRNGVIHRDIKPDNILMDTDGNAYLTDFGIAKVLGKHTLSDAEEGISGSPAYMSPEQLRSETVQPQTDIYGMGVVLYEILCGEHPFWDGGNLYELLQKQMHESLPDVHLKRPDLPPTVSPIVHRATEKDPKDRYPTITALAKDFRRAISCDATITAHDTMILTALSNPYKGLRAFEEADAAHFFGREALVEKLLQNFRQFMAVVGPSGSGKSSVVQAGFIPALRRGKIDGSEKWFIVEMTPGPHPLEQLTAALLSIAVNPPSYLADQLKSEVRGLLWAVDAVLASTGVKTQLLLFIDQFEEVFTLVTDEAERAHFLTLLSTALTEPNSPLKVVITLRADFYDKPLLYEQFGALIQQETQVVLPLTAQEIERAIVQPAMRVGMQVETDLVAAVVADVREEPGALPLLQYALTEAFERANTTVLTYEVYQASGGVVGAMARRAEEVYDRQDAVHQKTVHQIFLRLVTLGEGTEDTRRRVTLSELASIVTDKNALQTVLDHFGHYRLLTFDRELDSREPTVEIAHEALIRRWERLRQWIDTSRSDIRLQRLLSAAVKEWKNAGRGVDFLLQGGRLAQYEEWLGKSDVGLTQDENDYLQSSLSERSRREEAEKARQRREAELERRAANRLRVLVGVLVVAMVLAAGLSVFAFSRETAAKHASATSDANFRIAQQKALESQSLVLSANAQRLFNDGNTDHALVLALIANELLPTPPFEAQTVLSEIAYAPLTVHVFDGHEGWVNHVTMSPDGTLAASGAQDGTVRLWDFASGEQKFVLAGHNADVYGVVFSPDGQRIVSSAADNTIRVWNVADGTEIAHYEAEHNVKHIYFTEDGIRVVSTLEDFSFILWDLETGETLQNFTGHTTEIKSVMFSLDNQTAYSYAADATLKVWEVTTGAEIASHTLPFEADVTVEGMTVSKDEKTLVLILSDFTFVLWDSTDNSVKMVFEGHTDEVYEIAFTPNELYIVSASQDHTLRMWNVATGTEIHRFIGHNTFVNTVAVSPDGQMMLSGADDGLLRSWQLTDGATIRQFHEHTDTATFTDLHPDGSRFISASNDLTMKLWDMNTGEVLQTYTGLHTEAIRFVSFSRDGQQAVSSAEPTFFLLWEVATGEVIRRFEGHTDRATAIVFMPDGKHLLSSSKDGTAILWDINTGEIVRRYEGHDGFVTNLALSPDGNTFATSSYDSTLILWDVATGEMLQQFEGHEDVIIAVAFSPDGKYLASGSGDFSIRLWDVTTGEQIRQFDGHTDWLADVRFSPDGTRLVSGADDGTVRVWDVATGAEIRRFHMTAGYVYSVIFADDGRAVLATGDEGFIILWRIDTLEELLAWSHAERYVHELTCEERLLYKLVSTCE